MLDLRRPPLPRPADEREQRRQGRRGTKPRATAGNNAGNRTRAPPARHPLPSFSDTFPPAPPPKDINSPAHCGQACFWRSEAGAARRGAWRAAAHCGQACLWRSDAGSACMGAWWAILTAHCGQACCWRSDAGSARRGAWWAAAHRKQACCCRRDAGTSSRDKTATHQPPSMSTHLSRHRRWHKIRPRCDSSPPRGPQDTNCETTQHVLEHRSGIHVRAMSAEAVLKHPTIRPFVAYLALVRPTSACIGWIRSNHAQVRRIIRPGPNVRASFQKTKTMCSSQFGHCWMISGKYPTF